MKLSLRMGLLDRKGLMWLMYSMMLFVKILIVLSVVMLKIMLKKVMVKHMSKFNDANSDDVGACLLMRALWLML